MKLSAKHPEQTSCAPFLILACILVLFVSHETFLLNVVRREHKLHADEIETSVMMSAHPEMVDTGKITPELSASVEKWHQSADCLGDLTAAWFIDDISVEGVVGEPIRASAEFGKTFMERQAEQIARALELAGELSRRSQT